MMSMNRVWYIPERTIQIFKTTKKMYLKEVSVLDVKAPAKALANKRW